MQEGSAAPEAPADPEADAPTFDPGGDTALPFEVAPSPGGGGDDTGTGPPLDAEPLHDPDNPHPSTKSEEAPASSETPAPTTGDEPADAPTPPADAPTPTSPAPSTPPAAPPAQTHRLQPEAAPAPRSASRLIAHDRVRIGRSAEPPPNSFGGAPRVTASPTTPAVQGAEAVEQQPVVHTRARSADPNPDARVHVVEPGESLWAIAEELLDPDASAARISREVQRLWSLNEARIGTGDPDLLMVGTELRLT